VVRIGEVFRAAVEAPAAAVIVVHNHPSGDPSPSPEDIKVTRQLVQAGKVLDIELLDHVIIGDGRYTSLKEKGLGFD
jgi:DNA repair protein RadC